MKIFPILIIIAYVLPYLCDILYSTTNIKEKKSFFDNFNEILIFHMQTFCFIKI